MMNVIAYLLRLKVTRVKHFGQEKFCLVFCPDSLWLAGSLLSVGYCFQFLSMKIRYEDINPTFIKGLVISLMSAHLILWTCCYTISALNGTMQYPNLFLSSAMQFDPARGIACILFPTVGILTGMILVLRSVLLASRLKTKAQVNMWYMFNACIVLSVAGMIVVPAIPYVLNKVIHLTAAFTVFISGFTIMFVSTCLDRSLRLPVVTWMKHLRRILTVIALAGSVGFGVFFNYIDIISSISELVAATSMTGFICTLAHDSDFFSRDSKDTVPQVATDIPHNSTNV
jgi:hypothetical protein